MDGFERQRERETPKQEGFLGFEHVLPDHLNSAGTAVAGGVVAAEPANLTTTFYDATSAGTTEDATLGPKLKTVLSQTKYARLGTNIAVSVVDLSGANKFKPKYAGFNDEANFYAASTAKVCGMAAGYQFAADVDNFLVSNSSIADMAELEKELKGLWTKAGVAAGNHPLVSKVLAFSAGTPPTVKLRPEMIKVFDGLSEGNANGTTAIVLLKFPFIGSTMLAQGLFSAATKSGLWLRYPYGGAAYMGKYYSIDPRGRGNPYPRTPIHCVSAVSMAQFFTLAAQGRLVDRASSKAMINHLDITKGGCATNQVTLTTLRGKGLIAVKCGIWTGVVHVPLYYKDSTSSREFVIVILTKNSKYRVLKGLFDELLALVP